jgi:hypothetical protein
LKSLVACLSCEIGSFYFITVNCIRIAESSMKVYMGKCGKPRTDHKTHAVAIIAIVSSYFSVVGR